MRKWYGKKEERTIKLVCGSFFFGDGKSEMGKPTKQGNKNILQWKEMDDSV